ncbi:hypothetical protein HNQ74_000195 [Bartonella doshiae]|nr:hypothetical protein [Bartonella doshiae]
MICKLAHLFISQRVVAVMQGGVEKETVDLIGLYRRL